MNISLNLDSVLISALAGATITALVNWYLTRYRQKWDERKYLIELGRELCKELMALTARYNQMDPTSTEAKILSVEIVTYISLIVQFVNDKLTQDTDIEKALKSIMSLTEGDFATTTRLTDPKWTAKSIRAINRLHLLLLSAKPKH